MSATDDGTPAARRRSRWRRAAPPRFRPCARVARTLADLFYLGAAETNAVALLFHSHGEDAPSYFPKRWPRVWQAGYVTKLGVPVAPGLAGSVQDVYCVETGLAQAVMDAGRPLDQLPVDVASTLRVRADADRERVVALLAPHLPDAAAIPRRLKLHSEQARRCLAGASNLLAHATTNAGFVAPLLYAARRTGLAVGALRGDKDVLLRARTPTGEVLRAPDSAVVLGDRGSVTAFLVETETGSASVQRLRAKVDAWATIAEAHDRAFPAVVAAAIAVPAVNRVQVVVYGPARLLAHVEAAIAARCDARTRGLFRTVRDDVVHARFPGRRRPAKRHRARHVRALPRLLPHALPRPDRGRGAAVFHPRPTGGPMVPPPFLNLADAATFLRALGGQDSPFTFQTFDDTPAKRRSLARILHGSFREHRDALVRLNRQGAGVFVTVQVTNGRGRRTEDIVRLRALFIDCDVGELACGPEPAASIVVWSVRGAHCYWLLKDAPPLETFRAAQQRLALKYGTDPAVCDLARVMRVPGFVHARGEPSLVRLAVAYPECRYDLAEVLRSCPDLPRGIDDADHAAAYGSVRAFAAWAACKEVVVGRRNTTAYSIAAEGFRRGLAPSDVERVVSTFCWRAGIPAETTAILASAARRRSAAFR